MNDSEPRTVDATELLQDAALGKALLALNNAHAQELSWLEAERLGYLIGEALLARRIGRLDAFLLAFDQDARYDSPNFIWFRDRYPRFVYVDRIVVAPSARGRGCARRLYRDLFERRTGRARPHRLRGQQDTSEPGIRCLPCGARFCRGRHRRHPWRQPNGSLPVVHGPRELALRHAARTVERNFSTSPLR
jgi:GNAT superfamily N-acetyltransferase